MVDMRTNDSLLTIQTKEVHTEKNYLSPHQLSSVLIQEIEVKKIKPPYGGFYYKNFTQNQILAEGIDCLLALPNTVRVF